MLHLRLYNNVMHIWNGFYLKKCFLPIKLKKLCGNSETMTIPSTMATASLRAPRPLFASSAPSLDTKPYTAQYIPAPGTKGKRPGTINIEAGHFRLTANILERMTTVEAARNMPAGPGTQILSRLYASHPARPIKPQYGYSFLGTLNNSAKAMVPIAEARHSIMISLYGIAASKLQSDTVRSVIIQKCYGRRK